MGGRRLRPSGLRSLKQGTLPIPPFGDHFVASGNQKEAPKGHDPSWGTPEQGDYAEDGHDEPNEQTQNPDNVAKYVLF